MNTHALLRQRLLDKAGIHDPCPRLTLKDLEASWSPAFEQLMRNRLMMGCLRYGPIGKKGKPEYDRIAGIQKRLTQYVKTGNTEFLVDVANLALLEFEEGTHPKKHFKVTHDDHCGILK